LGWKQKEKMGEGCEKAALAPKEGGRRAALTQCGFRGGKGGGGKAGGIKRRDVWGKKEEVGREEEGEV